MAWSFEFKAGLVWAVVILVLMVVAMWAELAMGSLAPLIIPIVGWVAFFAWVSRIQK